MSGSVERALHILTELASGPTTISELARRLDVHRTTSLRLLRTLEDQRFVRRTEDGRYALGPQMTALASAALEDLDLRTTGRRHIRALGEMCGHTVHLAAIDDNGITYIDKVESTHTIRMYSRVGATAPAHATGVGKAILAHLSPDRRDQVLGPTPYRRCTPHTRTTSEALTADLTQIAAQGWALDDFEHEEFIHCVAAPVFDAPGQVVAAVSISVPQMVLEHRDLLTLVPDVVATAIAISEELGWSPR